MVNIAKIEREYAVRCVECLEPEITDWINTCKDGNWDINDLKVMGKVFAEYIVLQERVVDLYKDKEDKVKQKREMETDAQNEITQLLRKYCTKSNTTNLMIVESENIENLFRNEKNLSETARTYFENLMQQIKGRNRS